MSESSSPIPPQILFAIAKDTLSKILQHAPADTVINIFSNTLFETVTAVPDPVWQEFMNLKFIACDAPGCRCHEDKEDLRKLLISLRENHLRKLAEAQPPAWHRG